MDSDLVLLLCLSGPLLCRLLSRVLFLIAVENVRVTLATRAWRRAALRNTVSKHARSQGQRRAC